MMTRTLIIVLVGGIFPLALFLQGCFVALGDSVSVKKKTSVIVMRHCVRALPFDSIYSGTQYRSFDNFSRQEWPRFSVPARFCLPRGEAIVKAQGSFLKARGGLPTPIRAIADSVYDPGQRDEVTMMRFLEGLAVDSESVTTKIDPSPFKPASSDACETLHETSASSRRSMQESLDVAPFENDENRAILAKLYAALGDGVVGNWTGIPCKAVLSDSPWLKDMALPAGACNVASEVTEMLLMQWGGGMEVGWGRIDPNDIPYLHRSHMWWFTRTMGNQLYSEWKGSSLLRSIALNLEAAEEGTTLYVGHDGDLSAISAVLNVIWDASPFPINATLPGSMLRFDREGDVIHASFMYVANFSRDTGEMLTVPAQFQSSDGTISIDGFKSAVLAGTLEACANPPGAMIIDSLRPQEAPYYI